MDVNSGEVIITITVGSLEETQGEEIDDTECCWVDVNSSKVELWLDVELRLLATEPAALSRFSRTGRVAQWLNSTYRQHRQHRTPTNSGTMVSRAALVILLSTSVVLARPEPTAAKKQLPLVIWHGLGTCGESELS